MLLASSVKILLTKHVKHVDSIVVQRIGTSGKWLGHTRHTPISIQFTHDQRIMVEQCWTYSLPIYSHSSPISLMANRLTNPAFITILPDFVDGCAHVSQSNFQTLPINIPLYSIVFPYYGCQHLLAYPIISPSERLQQLGTCNLG